MNLKIPRPRAGSAIAWAPFAIAALAIGAAAWNALPRQATASASEEDETLVVSLAEIRHLGGTDVRWGQLQRYYGLTEDQISRSIALTAERNGDRDPPAESADTLAARRVSDSGDPIVISLAK